MFLKIHLFRDSLCHRCTDYWKIIFISPSNRRQQERLKHLPVVFQENFQKLKLEMSTLFLCCCIFSGFDYSKTNVERGSLKNVNRLSSCVCSTKSKRGQQKSVFPRVSMCPRKWHRKTKEQENSTFFHCFMVGWNECFRWAWVKLCFVAWSQSALFCWKG